MFPSRLVYRDNRRFRSLSRTVSLSLVRCPSEPTSRVEKKIAIYNASGYVNIGYIILATTRKVPPQAVLGITSIHTVIFPSINKKSNPSCKHPFPTGHTYVVVSSAYMALAFQGYFYETLYQFRCSIEHCCWVSCAFIVWVLQSLVYVEHFVDPRISASDGMFLAADNLCDLILQVAFDVVKG